MHGLQRYSPQMLHTTDFHENSQEIKLGSQYQFFNIKLLNSNIKSVRWRCEHFI